MSNNIIELVASYVGLSPNSVLELSKNAHRTYRRYFIPKKRGGQRIIFHPSKSTKALQYGLIETILNRLPVHQCAAAYVGGRKSPLLVNAEKHSRYSYTVRIDFKDFFPSIGPRDLLKVLRESAQFGKINKQEEKFIKRSLFIKYRNGKLGLAIGAPSSPIISNIVMYSLDEEFQKLGMSVSTNSVYTRYADDIIFSTNKKGGCREFYKGFEEIIGRTNSPNLTINKQKTVFTSRGTKRVVTGLHICPDGQISIGRSNKRFIKKLIHDFRVNALDSEKRKYLSGYLSFILDVEPDFYNRLALKYGGELLSRAHKGNVMPTNLPVPKK